MAGYREPGLYIKYEASGAGALGGTPYLIPTIMGSGPRYLKKTISVVRGSSTKDKLPISAEGMSDFTVLRIGRTTTSTDYYSDVTIKETADYKNILQLDPDGDLSLKKPAEDYTLSVDSDSKIVVTWSATTTEDQIMVDPSLSMETAGQHEESTVYIRRNRKPSEGSTYYIELIYPVNKNNTPNQYEPTLISLQEDIESVYGGLLMYTDHTGTQTTINKLGLGVYLAMINGAGLVYAQQVEYDKSKPAPDQFDYTHALVKLQNLTDVYRIVAMDKDNNITNTIVSHVTQMSSPEEKAERRLFAGCGYQMINSFLEMQKTVGDYAKSIHNERVGILGAYDATIAMPDGTTYTLPAGQAEPFLCAALAGLEAGLPIHQSITKSGIVGFTELIEKVNMLRTQKNMLAEKGVILLEQKGGPGSPIIVRHGLTTNMDTTQTRESSITTIRDYTGKMLRATLDKYIGKDNITMEGLVKIKGAVDSVLDNLISSKIIVKGEVNTLQQDSNQPDSVILTVNILPPYPCNYINVVVYTS